MIDATIHPVHVSIRNKYFNASFQREIGIYEEI
jgi:hypothetical protein